MTTATDACPPWCTDHVLPHAVDDQDVHDWHAYRPPAC